MLSIIVPVYNVKEYVRKCLDSLLCQQVEDYEVIIIDDGSTDGSQDIVDTYGSSVANFNVFHKENGGLMSAWLEGLKHAQGEYVGFVDSDDYVEEDMFSSLYFKAKETNADIVMCNHAYETISGDIISINRSPISEGLYRDEALKEIIQLAFPSISHNYISPSRCNKIFKKDLLLQNLKYLDQRITSGEDVNIVLPCILHCTSFYYMDKTLYHYVYRKTSISRVFKYDLLESYEILIKKIAQATQQRCCELIYLCDNLYNFYGFLWTIYVQNSSLNLKQKSKQIRRLSNNDKFLQAIENVDTDINSRIYAMTIQFKCPHILLVYNSMKKITRKIIGRK